MKTEFKFDSLFDVEPVVPGLSVDVAEAMATHRVLSTGVTTPYNKIDNPADMGHYCTDKIQTTMAALRLGNSIAAASSGKPSESNSQQAAE